MRRWPTGETLEQQRCGILVRHAVRKLRHLAGRRCHVLGKAAARNVTRDAVANFIAVLGRIDGGAKSRNSPGYLISESAKGGSAIARQDERVGGT